MLFREVLTFDGTFAHWRDVARAALARGVVPDSVQWQSAHGKQAELLLEAPAEYGAARADPADVGPVQTQRSVPRRFIELGENAACHRDPERWRVLYRVLWRLTHGEAHLLDVATDRDVVQLSMMSRAVHRDLHRMRAFVRFKEVHLETGPAFMAWYEPDHDIVELNAPFFRDRFASMRWSIFTPDRSVHWDGNELQFTSGARREDVPPLDAAEELWRTYYSSTFNPARVNAAALTRHIPTRMMRNLPEAAAVPALVADARTRATAMVAESAADVAAENLFSHPPIPAGADISALRAAAANCRACPLWRNATCTVFGEGPPTARIVIVGEQPGDNEDRAGRAFIGPAGQLLDRAFAAAGIVRSEVYITGAVKHFKWEPQGKRRLHKRASPREIAACRPWLEAELQAIRPTLIVCLGVTAAETVLRRPVRVLSERGEVVPTEFGAPALITVHPSALLRLPAGVDAEVEFAKFVADLQRVPARAKSAPSG